MGPVMLRRIALGAGGGAQAQHRSAAGGNLLEDGLRDEVQLGPVGHIQNGWPECWCAPCSTYSVRRQLPGSVRCQELFCKVSGCKTVSRMHAHRLNRIIKMGCQRAVTQPCTGSSQTCIHVMSGA